MKFELTPRNFLISKFKDLYGKECSLQQSSLATDNAIWLGCSDGTHYDKDSQPVELPAYVTTCACRMHLNRKLVGKLLPTLIKFYLFGRL